MRMHLRRDRALFCRQAVTLMSAYLDGELPDPAHNGLEEFVGLYQRWRAG